ncbi:MAG: PorV/PorQ family protein [Calditrichaeota bacterium]|nr:PorV/PorQ family protein [Calditrichota bacterium]
MIVRMVFTALILVAGVSTTRAQEVTKVGTDAAPFLTIPVGARGAAVGGALVAMADDASAAYWNPGGLARVERNALMVDHSPWLPGLSFNFFSLALPVGNGAVGLNITSLGTEEMDITTPDQPMGTGETYTAASMAVGLSYAQRLTESFSIGGTVKYINERILNSSAVGVAFDIGTLYDTPFKGVRLGVSVANYGSKMQMRGEDLNIRVDIAPDQNGNNQSVVGQFKTDRFDLPLTMRVGLSWDALQQGGNRLTLAVDGVNPSHNAQSVNVGGEYAMFNETLVLRGGYTDLFLEDSEKGLTLGAGFQAKIQGSIGFSVNYAYQDFEHLGGVDRISVLLSF